MLGFRILGPVQALSDGTPVQLARKPRGVLAILLLNANTVVPADRLVEELWAGSPPPSGPGALQVYVSQLRKALGGGAVVTRDPGYLLELAPDQLDLARFERLAADGRKALAADRAEEAASALRAALALWQGPALADFGYEPFAQGEIARLDELRLAALEDRVDADLALGRHGELVGELEALVGEHPLRERLRGQLMLALYRSGRQADALASYQDARRALVDELGIDPSPELQRLEQAILNQDRTLDLEVPSAQLAGNLPAAPTALIGRSSEVAEVASLLRRRDVRLVTLTGPGGIGKTRLALEVATELASDLADGAWFVDLSAVRDPSLAMPTVAQVVGVREGGAAGALEALKAELRGKKLLLVLDNLEQVLDVAPAIAELLAGAAGLTAIATSRAPLHVLAERQYPVAPLALPAPDERNAAALAQVPAVTLLVERARAVRPDFALTDANARAAAEVCVRLDGLPLALELAAARLKLLTPEQLLERLGQRLPILTDGPRDLPARQQTLRAAIGWSYELLAPADRELLARLAVFAGGWSLPAAEATCADGGDVLAGLATLVDVSLVRESAPALEEPRYSLLETIREFALERLEELGEADEVRRRHADFFTELAVAAEPELTGQAQGVWIDRLAREHDNLRGAIAWALERDASVALRLAAALWRWWYIRGHWSEGRGWLDATLAGAPDAQAELRARALTGAGVLARNLGDVDLAEKRLREGLELRRELGDKAGIAASTNNLGNTLFTKGDAEGARRLWEESLALHRELGNPAGVISALSNVGLAAWNSGDGATATACYGESMALAREHGHELAYAVATQNLGDVRLGEGDPAEARTLFRDVLRRFRAFGMTEGVATALDGLAASLALLGEPRRAVRLFAAADARREAIGAQVQPQDREELRGRIEVVRAALGEEAFAAAWAEGAALPIEDALADALAESREPSATP